MNFFSKRDLQDLTSENTDVVIWLFIGLLVGYALSGGVSNVFARGALVFFFMGGFTHQVLSITNALDRWKREGPIWNRKRPTSKR